MCPWHLLTNLLELRARATWCLEFRSQLCSFSSTSHFWTSVFLLCKMGQCKLWMSWIHGRDICSTASAYSRCYMIFFPNMAMQGGYHMSKTVCFFLFLMSVVNKIFLQRPKTQNNAKLLNTMRSWPLLTDFKHLFQVTYLQRYGDICADARLTGWI